MSTTAPFGFRPVRNINGSPWNGQTIACVPASGTAIFVGDIVNFDGSAATANVGGVDVVGLPTVIRCNTTNTGQNIAGVVVGFMPEPANLSRTHMGAAATDVKVALVAPATIDTVFEAVVDESGTVFATTHADVMMNHSLVTTAGSTVTGRSNMMVQGGSANTTATLPVRVLGVSKRLGNTVQSATTTIATTTGGVVVDVIFNTSKFAPNSVGV
jgi:hypothetical protein